MRENSITDQRSPILTTPNKAHGCDAWWWAELRQSANRGLGGPPAIDAAADQCRLSVIDATSFPLGFGQLGRHCVMNSVKLQRPLGAVGLREARRRYAVRSDF